jgi:hypothetical protein
MDQPINIRQIIFAGSKAGGSQRLEVPFDLDVEQDYPITLSGHTFIYNCVTSQKFSNGDGTVNMLYTLKHTGE